MPMSGLRDVSIGSPCSPVRACSLRASSPTASGSVSKLAATPTWYFYCCAIFFPLFALLYYLTDVRGHARWFAWVKPAGHGGAVVLRGGLCVESVEEPDLFRSAASFRIFGRDSGACQFVPLRAVAHLDRLAVGPRRGEAQGLIRQRNAKRGCRKDSLFSCREQLQPRLISLGSAAVPFSTREMAARDGNHRRRVERFQRLVGADARVGRYGADVGFGAVLRGRGPARDHLADASQSVPHPVGVQQDEDRPVSPTPAIRTV